MAAVGGVLTVGLNNWALPAFTESSKFAQQALRDRETALGMQAQTAALEHQSHDPDAAVKASLAQMKQRLSAQEPRVQEMQKSLVAPQAMTAFLQNLLAGNRSLQLRNLETLPAEPALANPVPSGTAANDKTAAETSKLYKHGVRMRLAGSYRDLLAYVTELERAPQRVLWGDMKLDAAAYPRVEMTLTIYTLSLDKTWLVL